jgi:hypothetical protein
MAITKGQVLERARQIVIDSGVKKYFRLRYDGLRWWPWGRKPEESPVMGHKVRVLSTRGAFKPYTVVVKV